MRINHDRITGAAKPTTFAGWCSSRTYQYYTFDDVLMDCILNGDTVRVATAAWKEDRKSQPNTCLLLQSLVGLAQMPYEAAVNATTRLRLDADY
jgi:hypothetical protein